MRMIAIPATAIVLAAFTVSARAQAIIDFTQVGSDVDVTLSGSINTSGLEFYGVTSLYGSEVIPDHSVLAFNFSGQSADYYGFVNGPGNFGSGARSSFSVSSGDIFAYDDGDLSLPVGYVSGSALSATGVFVNTTLADLGVTIGVYDYTWGTGNGAGYFQVDIGQAVPEPASLPVIVAGLVGLAWVYRRRTTAIPVPFVIGS